MKVLVIMPENPTLPKLQVWMEFNKLSEVVSGNTPPRLLGGDRATRNGVASALKESYDAVIWSGHGDVGRLAVSDGFVSSDWLAVQLRNTPPGVIVLAACMSGARDEDLDSMAETISQAGINVVGMWVSVEDNAAIAYNEEFLRCLDAGSGLGMAHRVAVREMIDRYPTMAGSAFLMPGLLNGYGKIKHELVRMNDRIGGLESGMAEVKTTMTEVMRRIPK